MRHFIGLFAFITTLCCACSKSPAPSKPTTAAAASTVKKPATAAADSALDQARHRKALEETFHRSRCAMLGESKNPWAASPWDNEAGFRKDFDSAAENDPVWAQETIAASYRRACRPSLETLRGADQKPPANKPVKADKVEP